MTTASRNAIPNTKGLLVYDIDLDNFCITPVKDGNACLPITTGQHGWSQGTTIQKDKINFLGTTNNVPLNFRVNNQPSEGSIGKRRYFFWL